MPTRATPRKPAAQARPTPARAPVAVPSGRTPPKKAAAAAPGLVPTQPTAAAPAAQPAKPARAMKAGQPAQAAKVVKAPKSPKAPKAPKPRKAVAPAKPPKLKRKPVRDSFTMPEADFALVATLKARALATGRETKKSELLRAGLHALAAMQTSALVEALQGLEPVKVGRPKKD
jgi:hypothetical protein